MAGGRPTKYTAATVKRICAAIAKGSTYKLAAAYGGISYDLFNDWMRERVQFLHAVQKAEAEATARWLDVIDAAAHDGNWQAAAWKLERRYPDDYGRRERQQVEHSGQMSMRNEVVYVNDWKAPAAAASTSTAESEASQ